MRHLFFSPWRFPHLLQHCEQGMLHLGEAQIPHPGCGAAGAGSLGDWPASQASPMKEMPAMSVKILIAFCLVILLLPYILQELLQLIIFLSLNKKHLRKD